MAPSLRAFVAGASGYVGGHVVRELIGRDVTTTAHVRPESEGLERARARLTALGATIDTTPWEVDALRAAFAARPPTHVFALVGTTRARMRRDPTREESYETVDLRTTELLIEPRPGAIAERLGVRYVIAQRSAGFLGREPGAHSMLTALFVRDGEVVWHASHGGITRESLRTAVGVSAG